MASIKLQGATSGEITVTVPNVAGTNTLTLPATTGNIVTTGDSSTITQGMIGSNVASAGPAFSAYANAALSITGGVPTKIQMNTEEFDTNSNYDNVTNYRFTPTVAGYYQVSGSIGGSPTSAGYFFTMVYKNGSNYKSGANFPISGTYGPQSVCSSLVYLNGSTDYIELYGQAQNTNSIGGASSITFFQAFLARAA